MKLLCLLFLFDFVYWYCSTWTTFRSSFLLLKFLWPVSQLVVCLLANIPEYKRGRIEGRKKKQFWIFTGALFFFFVMVKMKMNFGYHKASLTTHGVSWVTICMLMLFFFKPKGTMLDNKRSEIDFGSVCVLHLHSFLTGKLMTAIQSSHLYSSMVFTAMGTRRISSGLKVSFYSFIVYGTWLVVNTWDSLTLLIF